jgi:lysophospholipase L1-like esterase
MLLLAACGGADSDVHALVTQTTAPGGQADGPDTEMAAEDSVDESTGAARVAPELPAGAPSDLPEASLPPHALSDELPDTAAVVGDSLTESAQQEIAAYLNGLGIDVVAIDGAKNRRMVHGAHPDPGIDVVERIARVTRPDLWVIALGTNDVGSEVSREQFAHDTEQLLAAVPPGAPVVWVDIWIRDRQPQVQVANDILRDTLGPRPDTIVADWFSHGDDPGIVTADGIHLTDDGRYVFAATIASATVDLFD